MRLFVSAAAAFLVTASSAAAEETECPAALDLMPKRVGLELPAELRPNLQFPRVRFSRPRSRPRFRLFPGPNHVSVSFGLSYVPLVGNGAADDADPPLAGYRD